MKRDMGSYHISHDRLFTVATSSSKQQSTTSFDNNKQRLYFDKFIQFTVFQPKGLFRDEDVDVEHGDKNQN